MQTHVGSLNLAQVKRLKLWPFLLGAFSTPLLLYDFDKHAHHVHTDISKLTTQLSQPIEKLFLVDMRPTKIQTSLRISAVSPETLLFAQLTYGDRLIFRRNFYYIVSLASWSCTFKDRINIYVFFIGTGLHARASCKHLSLFSLFLLIKHTCL